MVVGSSELSSDFPVFFFLLFSLSLSFCIRRFSPSFNAFVFKFQSWYLHFWELFMFFYYSFFMGFFHFFNGCIIFSSPPRKLIIVILKFSSISFAFYVPFLLDPFCLVGFLFFVLIFQFSIWCFPPNDWWSSVSVYTWKWGTKELSRCSLCLSMAF